MDLMKRGYPQDRNLTPRLTPDGRRVFRALHKGRSIPDAIKIPRLHGSAGQRPL